MTSSAFVNIRSMFFTGLGLRIKKTCTRSADTICEPLEGFYCTEQKKNSCRFAVKHSECYPGQYVKQTGEYFRTQRNNGHRVEGQLALLKMLTQKQEQYQ